MLRLLHSRNKHDNSHYRLYKITNTPRILEWLWSRRCVFSVCSVNSAQVCSVLVSSERFVCSRGGDLIQMNMLPDERAWRAAATRDWQPAGCQGRSLAVIDDQCVPLKSRGEMCDTRAKTRMWFLTGTETTPRWCLGYADRTPPAWEPAWLVFLDSHFPKPPQIQWHSLCSPRSLHVPYQRGLVQTW